MHNLDLFAQHSAAPPWHDALTLWLIVNQSLRSYRTVVDHFSTPTIALQAGLSAWQQLDLDARHRQRFVEWPQHKADQQRLANMIQAIEQGRYHLLLAEHTHYPRNLLTLDDAPPLLFVAGNLDCLLQPQMAVVGTRKPSPSGRRLAYDFSRALAEQGLWISSGLAHGVDAEAHLGALSLGGGRTLAVLGTGLEVCYPPQHRGLYDRIVAEGGAVLSEFLPDTAPQAYNFPRRNRLVSGLSLGVLVVEAALKSGSLITARLAAEQGRLVFAIPGHVDNPQARGCHHLIREGAILVDEPAQILDDLALPRQWQHVAQQAQASVTTANTTTATTTTTASTAVAPVDIPAHLQRVLAALDWSGLDMDQLVDSTALDVASLSSQLMELELLGHVVQVGGRYQRCRAAL